jgi:hypothetical protein
MKVRSLKHRHLFTNVGKRCKDFQWGCIICESYKFLDLRGRFPNSFDEVYEWAQPHRYEYNAAPERATEVWYRQKDKLTRFGKRKSV